MIRMRNLFRLLIVAFQTSSTTKLYNEHRSKRNGDLSDAKSEFVIIGNCCHHTCWLYHHQYPNHGQCSDHDCTLTYHKVKLIAKIGSHYQQFKLTNHVVNSNYQHIQTTSWKKSGLKKGTKVVVDMYANQGLQSNWYRISKYAAKKKSQTKPKVQKYWVYGQALVLPKSFTF